MSIVAALTKFLAYHLCVASALPQSRWCLHAITVEDSILYYQSYCQSPQPGERKKNKRKLLQVLNTDIYTSEIIIYHKGRHREVYEIAASLHKISP